DTLTVAAQTWRNEGNALGQNGVTAQIDGTLTNQGQMQGRALSVTGDTLRNGGTLQATDSLKATLSQTLENNGALLSQNQADVSAAQLTNNGTLAARALTVQAPDIINRGTLAGNDSLSLTARNLYNDAHGQLATGGGLMLD
ncbi:hypothetical protein, partial [Cronobacter sakazakii]